MPIEKSVRHLYGKNPKWLEAKALVRQRAGNRCEVCNRKNGSLYAIDKKGHAVEISAKSRLSSELLGYRVLLIQCGCSHTDHRPAGEIPLDEFYRVDKLAFWCRGDHLKFDRPQHKRSRQTHRDSRRPLLAMLQEAAG